MGWRSAGWCAYMQSQLEKEQRQAYYDSIPDYGRCPECGGYLRKRNGRYGEFLGCSNYPECRHHEKLNED